MRYRSTKAHRNKWKQQIIACAESKLSIRSWCQANGILYSTFGYWRKRLFPAGLPVKEKTSRPFQLTPQEDFTELEDGVDDKEVIQLKYRDVSIFLKRDFDAHHLYQCLETIRRL